MILIGSVIYDYPTRARGEVLGCSERYLRVRFHGRIRCAALTKIVRKDSKLWWNAPESFGGQPLVGDRVKRKKPPKMKLAKPPKKPRVKLADKVAAVCDELGIDVETLKRRCKMTGLTLREFVDDEQEEALGIEAICFLDETVQSELAAGVKRPPGFSGNFDKRKELNNG